MASRKDDVICSRCHRVRYSFSTLTCKHPAVNEFCGDRICMYCCAKCKHHVKGKWGGIRCGYNVDPETLSEWRKNNA